MLHLPDEYLSVYYIDADEKKPSKLMLGEWIYPGYGYYFYTGVDQSGVSYGPFQCCGSQVAHGLNGVFKDHKQRQDATALWLRRRHDYLNWYFIASSSQIKQKKELSVLTWLEELGAKVVDVRPNRYHTPNDLYLYVLSFENLDKFVVNNGAQEGASSDSYGHTPTNWEPLWWASMKHEDQLKWLDRNKERVEEVIARRKMDAEAQKKRYEDRRLYDRAYDQYAKNDRSMDLKKTFQVLTEYGASVIRFGLKKQFQHFIDLCDGKVTVEEKDEPAKV